MRAEFFQQVIEVRQTIRLMTVDDEIFFPFGRRVDNLARNGYPAKSGADELLDEFVMVSGDINNLCLPPAFAEQFLNEDVIIVAPEPAEF